MNSATNSNSTFTIEKCKSALNYLHNFFNQLENDLIPASSSQADVSSKPSNSQANKNSLSKNGNGQSNNSNPFEITLNPGKYKAIIENFESNVYKNGKKYVKWTLRILEPTNKDELVSKIITLDGENTIKWLLSDLKLFGIILKVMPQLPIGSIYPEFVGKVVVMEVKESVKDKNRYINLMKVIDQSDSTILK